jgi:hypothetical protein
MADEKGTGKHPHSNSNEEGSDRGRTGTQTAEREENRNESRNQGEKGREGSSDDLKKREYRDEKGEIHHHTHTYEEQHKGEK